MAINGINNQSNISSLYNSIFGIGSNSDSGSSYGISDFAMIRNGSYGKLMKAYYGKENRKDRFIKDRRGDQGRSDKAGQCKVSGGILK